VNTETRVSSMGLNASRDTASVFETTWPIVSVTITSMERDVRSLRPVRAPPVKTMESVRISGLTTYASVLWASSE
jgi:hypothetical protein